MRDLQTQTTSWILSDETLTASNFALSADGRYLSFRSAAPDIVADDTNGDADVFVLDRQTGTAQRASVGTGGTQATAGGGMGSMSADGRFVAFASGSPDLVPGDTNDHADVFVHDLLTGDTTRVSVASDGSQALRAYSGDPSISADGRYVAFDLGCREPGRRRHQRRDGRLRPRPADRGHHAGVGRQRRPPGPPAEHPSTGMRDWSSRLSADGRYVVFESSAEHLVPGDTNGVVDVFVHDLRTGNTTRVSIATTGQQANGPSRNSVISADGHFVAFISSATNLVPQATNSHDDVFVRIIH